MHVLHAVNGRRVSRLAVVGMALALFACDDQRITGVPNQTEPAQLVARSLSAAMADESVRLSVRDAMRLSVVDGHKLVLQDFLASPQGALLMHAATRAAGREGANFQALVGGLPEMDFYMPVREHRRTWKGDGNIAVIAAQDGDGTLPAYKPDGSQLRAERTTPRGLPPFFFLEPAEPKRRRVDAQAARPGDVIEDANDGLGSRLLVWREPNGDSLVFDFSVMTKEERNVLFAGELDTTKVDYFEHYVCDNGYCWTDSEFRFNTTFKDANGNVLGSGTFYVAGLHPDEPDPYYFNAPIIFKRILQNSGQTMYIHIIEEDRGDWGGFNPDDNCGAHTITQNQNGSVMRYYNTSDCEGGVGAGYFGGYALEAQYLWTPKLTEPPPPPPTWYATIQGPTSAEPNNFCNWYASTNVADAQYQWYQNGTPVGNGAELLLTVSSSFTLELQVWNSQGHGSGTSIYVDVQEGNGSCFMQ